MLPVGEKAPNFTLPSTSGKDFTLYVDMLLRPCILYFYPKDFTTGCTEQACGFRDTFDTFIDLDISIIGISRDDITTHLRFKKELSLPFELLADAGGEISKRYGTVPALMPFFTKRTTYLLDKHQRIVSAYENIFSSGKHIQEMVEKVKASFSTRV